MPKMSELPENIDLNWLGQTLLDARRETREGFAKLHTDMQNMREDMDMLIRLATRVDTTLDAVRADIRSLWLGQGALRKRIEALEGPEV